MSPGQYHGRAGTFILDACQGVDVDQGASMDSMPWAHRAEAE